MPRNEVVERMKICTKCGKHLLEDQFYYSPERGFTSKCKVCIRAESREWTKNHRAEGLNYRRANRRKRAEYARQQYLKNGCKMTPARLKGIQRWHKEHPEVAVSSDKVYYALQKGTLIRPQACSICGCVDRRLCAHHEDYDKPLDVQWLCYSCHARLHFGANAFQLAREAREERKRKR